MPILTVYARLTATALRWAQSPVMIFSSRGETRTLTGLLPGDFLTTIVFTTGFHRLWSGLYLNHIFSDLGPLHQVSTPFCFSTNLARY